MRYVKLCVSEMEMANIVTLKGKTSRLINNMHSKDHESSKYTTMEPMHPALVILELKRKHIR